MKKKNTVTSTNPQRRYFLVKEKDTRSEEQRLYEDKWSKHPANAGKTFADFLKDRAQVLSNAKNKSVFKAVALTGEIITGIDMKGNGASEYNQTFVNNQR